MEKVGLSQRRGTEKAIIDALLKISDIVQKTEASRHRQKPINTKKPSKNTVGDGDCNVLHQDDDVHQQVPVPPPMRTLDSYVSEFNQQSFQTPSNCNQASADVPKQYQRNCSYEPSRNTKRDDQSSIQELSDNGDEKDQECSYKRHYYETSCSSDDHEYYSRKKAIRHCTSQRSFHSDTSSQPICEELKTTDNQPTIATLNSSNQIKSAATTICNGRSSSSLILPVTLVPSNIEQQQPSINSTLLQAEQQQHLPSSSNKSADLKKDSNTLIDQQLQTTLEKHLRNYLLSTSTTNHENIGQHQQQRKTRLASFKKFETGKLMDEFNFTKQVCNLEYYEKQRELGMLAAKQGNYSLSHSIYTNLLHDRQYDYKLKSEILASRATTLLLDQKCFESIDDCTQAIAFNQWNKLAYVVRAACWMIKQEYSKAVEDYSKLFHFFDQSQHVLDLLNLAYERLKTRNHDIDGDDDDEQSIKIEQEKEEIRSLKGIKNENKIIQTMPSAVGTGVNSTQSLALASPTASFIQPAVYLCYPYQAYPTWYTTSDQQQLTNGQEIQQPTIMIPNASSTSHRSSITNQSPTCSEQRFHRSYETKEISSKSIHSNNNAIRSSKDSIATARHQSSSINKKKSHSNLIWIKHPYRSF